MKNLFWSGYIHQDRHTAINAIQHIISKYGTITDFKPFSDLALTLVVEIDSSKIIALYEALKSNMGIDGFDPAEMTSQKETTIFLNITFTKGTGDLKIEVPAVPG